MKAPSKQKIKVRRRKRALRKDKTKQDQFATFYQVFGELVLKHDSAVHQLRDVFTNHGNDNRTRFFVSEMSAGKLIDSLTPYLEILSQNKTQPFIAPIPTEVFDFLRNKIVPCFKHCSRLRNSCHKNLSLYGEEGAKKLEIKGPHTNKKGLQVTELDIEDLKECIKQLEKLKWFFLGLATVTWWPNSNGSLSWERLLNNSKSKFQTK